MSKPVQVGITGGIGAGKSVISKIFNCLGIPIYDSDQRAKDLMNEDQQLKTAIIKNFGTETYSQEGILNRGFLAALVFQDPEKTDRLSQLVHPRVAEDYERWLGEHQNVPYVIKEAALLIEAGIYQELDYLIVVLAPESLRIDRVLLRDPQRDRQQVLDIVARQVTDDIRQAKASFVIHNDGSTMVIPQVLAIHRELTN